MGEIPAGFVEKYYTMDPDHEDLLYDGKALRDGMIVLLADATERIDLDWPTNWRGARKLSKGEVFHARIYNRWARVLNLEFIDGDSAFQFVAEYVDGMKFKRMHPSYKAWLVRLDSLADAFPIDPKLI